MEFKEVQLEEIKHEHPLNLIDLQFMHQGYIEDDNDFEDNDLITVQKFKCTCDMCGLEIDWFNQYYYKCSNMSCNYSLHKFCAELSTTLQSPAHPAHILILKKRTTHWQCSDCLTDHQDDICYHCSTCNYELDLRCATFLEQKMIHHPCHPHPLISFSVDPILSQCACGKEHKGGFYHCATCLNFVVNSDCLSSPIKLLVKSHRSHMLTLSYSFWDQVYECECRICRKEIYKEYWLYKCSKCMFYVHVDCAIKHQHRQLLHGKQECEDKNSVVSESKIFSENGLVMYWPLSEESYNILPHHIPKQKSSLYFDESTNENCYIKHFSHKHPLVLIHNQSDYYTLGVKSVPLHDPMKRVKLLCNGCVMPVTSMPFYKCSQDHAECSNFILHEWCVRLRPEISNSETYYYIEDKYVLRQSCSLFSCKICGLPCNGFAYISDKYGQVDIHCAYMPYRMKHEGYPKPIFIKTDTFFREPVNIACGACGYIIKECFYYVSGHLDYRLHVWCALQSKFILKCLRCKFAIHSYCESSITISEKQEIVEMFTNLEKKREPKRNPQPPKVVTFYPKRITRPMIA